MLLLTNYVFFGVSGLSVNPMLLSQLFRLPPLTRRLLLIGIDALLLPLAVWLSFWLRLAQPLHPSFFAVGLWLLPAAWLVGLPLYALTGQYKGLTLYVGSSAFYRLSCRNGLIVLLLAGIGLTLRLQMPPRSSWILLWLVLTGFTGAVRFALRDLLLSFRTGVHKQQLRVAIYGAGEAGCQLAASLRLAGNHQIVTFLDDAPTLWKRTINGIPIQPPQVLSQIQSQLDQVLLAIPSMPRVERRRIVADLQRRSIPVLQIPSVDDLTSGRARIDALRPVSIEDLLGRDPVPSMPELLGPGLRNAVVCVTGAGGSIGSELCRQILQLEPKVLILLERSEPSLYALEQELRQQLSASMKLLPVLGSAADSALVQRLFASHAVQTVFHAAAYKHVPLVEANPLAGLANNVCSTRVVCQAAVATGVSQIVLISTDKAVRPTNVMGCQKRLAELVVQATAQELSQSSKCAGQPRTCRHGALWQSVPQDRWAVVSPPDRCRWADHLTTLRSSAIMTIPEAATLVLQSSVLAQGGDVFLLDMGEPVQIKALAEQMVRLMVCPCAMPPIPMGTSKSSALACALARSFTKSC